MGINARQVTGGGSFLGLSLIWLILFSVFATSLALAGGDHAEATPMAGGMRLMIFDGFQVELLGLPRPLRLRAENKIILKILRDGSLEPVRNGKVFIGVVPARLLNRASASDKAPIPQPDMIEVPLSPAPEVVWAGSYTLTRTFSETGPHRVRVALAELDGKTFNPPAVFDFELNVAPASGLSAGFALFALTAIVTASGGIYWAIVRARLPTRHKSPLNLLDISWLARFVTWKGFQPLLQIPTLIIIAVIAFLGFFDIQEGAKNLATKLTWILWWPGIIFTFILVGRLWCVMCPFGALNEWAANLFRPARLFPKALRNLWLATVAFLLFTWADEQIGIIRSPQLTAWVIVIFAVLSVGIGAVFQRRSFCHYLCPITGLVGLYSMVSPVEVRAADRSLCQKNCRQDCYRGNEKGNGCPMFEFPMTVDRNAFCNVCFECVRSCPSSNLALRFRSFGKDLWASGKRWLDEAYLSVVLVGVTTILTAQMITAWGGWISGLAKGIPLSLRVLMKPVTYLTVVESAVFFLGSLLLFPVLGLCAAWAVNRISGENGKGIKKTFTQLAYMFLPVGLAMHLAHNISHLVTEGPGVMPALQRTIARFTPIDPGEPNWQFAPLLSADVVYWLEMLLVLFGFVFSLIVGYRLTMSFSDRSEQTGKAFVPFVVLSLLFTLINFYLLNQPMGARHGA
ncbi:MAG: 4Fe-4S binding protein [Deltaproteobacteria bacterium]|nr:4Fe-4S binding protein [Deltaproteobacteria bacterium]